MLQRLYMERDKFCSFSLLFLDVPPKTQPSYVPIYGLIGCCGAMTVFLLGAIKYIIWRQAELQRTIKDKSGSPSSQSILTPGSNLRVSILSLASSLKGCPGPQRHLRSNEVYKETTVTLNGQLSKQKVKLM